MTGTNNPTKAAVTNQEALSDQKKLLPSPAARITNPSGQLATFRTSATTCHRKTSTAGVKEAVLSGQKTQGANAIMPMKTGALSSVAISLCSLTRRAAAAGS